MPVSQAQFDIDLAAYNQAVANCDAAADAYIAAVTVFLQQPAVVDLSAEDAAVNTALGNVTATQAALAAAQAALPPPPGGPKPAQGATT